MNPHEVFLRKIISNPEDPVPRLVYADWLDDQGHPFGEIIRRDWEVPRISFVDHLVQEERNLDHYLRKFPELSDRLDEYDANERFRHCFEEYRDTFDPDWLALIDTFARPFQPFFFWNNTGPRAFNETELPFNEQLGTRGSVITFASAFRGEVEIGPSILKDLRFLTELDLPEYWEGPAGCPIHPFICELSPHNSLTAAEVLNTLKCREFQSEDIVDLDRTEITSPGYNPTMYNDRIHNDPNGQTMFPEEDLDIGGALYSANAFLRLTDYVRDGQLWHVLLHSRIHIPKHWHKHSWVVLFMVGQSPHGERLIGFISHQMCRGFCD